MFFIDSLLGVIHLITIFIYKEAVPDVFVNDGLLLLLSSQSKDIMDI